MRLGIFVTITIAFLIAGIYYIGQKQQLFNSTFQISGIFKDISGLQVGNNVRFSGINVGIVDAIEQITDSTVKVDMQINEQSRKFMKKNANAVIGSDGLIGNKIVVIVPGIAGMAELANNDVIATVQPVNVDDILLKIKVTTDNMANISGDMAAITKNIHEGKGTIGELFMDSTMALNVYQAFVNIRQGAGGFKTNMDAASHSFLFKGYFKKKSKEEDKKAGK